MSATDISGVLAWEALDSRGKPTVACRVTLNGGAAGRAVAPSGASTGTYEAKELRDGGPRYGGSGVLAAVANVMTELSAAVIGRDAADQDAVDTAMEQADRSESLGRLGSNAVLAVSLATAVAYAVATEQPLYATIPGARPPVIPLPMVNILSGGAHAGGLLDIQDVLAVPVGAGSFAEAIEWCARVRRSAAQLLESRCVSAVLVADEGGLAAPLGRNEDGVALVASAIEHAGLRCGDDVGIAIDVAADQLMHTPGQYELRCEGRTLDAAEWLDELRRWCSRYPVVSLEDVLHEDDWTGWLAATEQFDGSVQLLGDDLFVTNAARLARGVESGTANAVLVKVNQAGTLSRAARVVRDSAAAGYAAVVSARSGDTEDSWLADLAVGWAAGQIKVGSTMRGERTAKWNRLLELEADTKCYARYIGREGLLRMTPSRAK